MAAKEEAAVAEETVSGRATQLRGQKLRNLKNEETSGSGGRDGVRRWRKRPLSCISRVAQ